MSKTDITTIVITVKEILNGHMLKIALLIGIYKADSIITAIGLLVR